MKAPPPRHLLPPHRDDGEPADVGTAFLRDDGTLELHLRSVGADGTIAEALQIYPPAHPSYARMLKHLKGLKPGGSCAIPPFPAREIDPDSV